MRVLDGIRMHASNIVADVARDKIGSSWTGHTQSAGPGRTQRRVMVASANICRHQRVEQDQLDRHIGLVQACIALELSVKQRLGHARLEFAAIQADAGLAAGPCNLGIGFEHTLHRADQVILNIDCAMVLVREASRPRNSRMLIAEALAAAKASTRPVSSNRNVGDSPAPRKRIYAIISRASFSAASA